MIKNNKGITLISLVATVIIILILSTIVVVNINTGEDFKNYKKMCADIDLLKDQILIYYNKYGVIPKENTVINASSIPEAEDETGNFYIIDLEKLSNLTLNYGAGEDNDDVYIINENSLNVYYLHGIEYDGNTLHTKE